MRHEPYATLDELLAPETLSRLSGAAVSSVRREPFVGGHSASGSGFLALSTNEGSGPRFVVKLSSPACDWIVRATGDTQGREVLVWTSGLLDRLPPELTHPVLAGARDGAGWAILMRDVAADLIPGQDRTFGAPISRQDHERYLDGLAALHATFWEAPELADPTFGLCTSWCLYTSLSHETGHREAAHPNEIVRRIREGWELLGTLIDPAMADLLHRLAIDPGPLCRALARYPQTLVHGDPRAANLGIQRRPRPRVVLLDWHFVGPSVPATDLAWYLDDHGYRVPMPLEESIARYRDR
nr:phosphotransferase [Chloroflexia bacterium]